MHAGSTHQLRNDDRPRSNARHAGESSAILLEGLPLKLWCCRLLMNSSGSRPAEATSPSNGPCCLVRSFQYVACRFPARIAVVHVSANSTATASHPGESTLRCTDAGETPKSERAVDVGFDGGQNIEGVDSTSDFCGWENYDPKLQETQVADSNFTAYRAGDVLYIYKELWAAAQLLAELLSHVLDIGCNVLVTEGTVWEDHAHLEIPDTCKLHALGSGLNKNSTHDSVRAEFCEQRIGVMMVQSAEYLVSLLAVMMNGAAFVPLDLSWPPGRLEAVVRASRPCLVIFCHHASWSPQRDLSRILTCVNCPILTLSESFLKAVVAKACVVRQAICRCKAAKTSYAYVLYTSGSTGNPKGVCGTEKGLMNRLQWMEETYPHAHDDVGCFKTAIGFVDHLTEALGPLLAGKVLIVPSQNQLARNPLALFKVLQDYPISRLVAVPSLLRALLPQLQERAERSKPLALRVLVLSGEPLPLSLWKVLDCVFSKAIILNLYGSTEVSGDCMYFDCSSCRDGAMETSTVPIGRPISGCRALVVSESGRVLTAGEGELWVTGVGVAVGYLHDSEETSKRFLQTWPSQIVCHDFGLLQCLQYPVFETGDFVRLLPDGSMLFLGRKDRLVKLHGQRLELEEVEAILQLHSAVMYAAVSVLESSNGEVCLVAYVEPAEKSLFVSKIVFRNNRDLVVPEEGGAALLLAELKQWLLERLPRALVPHRLVLLKSMPLTGSGKVDHVLLSKLLPVPDARVELANQEDSNELTDVVCHVESPELRRVRRVFAHVLNLNQVCPSDDFFALGGTSVSAAHVAHMLGINMQLLYSFPTSKELCAHLPSVQAMDSTTNTAALQQVGVSVLGDLSDISGGVCASKIQEKRTKDVEGFSATLSRQNKRKRGHEVIDDKLADWGWPYHTVFLESTALTRCNKFIAQKPVHSIVASIHVPLDEPGKLELSWKFSLNSCVDGSPLLVSTGNKWRLFVGSHKKNVVCLDAASGEVIWDTQVGGRVESSAIVSFDFQQVVVGCYDGLVYFLDVHSGSVVWTFKTGGEVKCQPTLDSSTGLIWCGSHDHKIYALDTTSQGCVWEHSCGGSIFGAPAVDEAKRRVYVASTGATITAIHTEPSPRVLWTTTCDAPVFGSPTVDPLTHFLICTLVNGGVTAITAEGVAAWKVLTQGPIFAGACLSASLPGQLLVGSRDGCIYALQPDSGHVLWKHCLDDPIIACCYVDESLEFSCTLDDASNRTTSRLVGVCTTGGKVALLRINKQISHEVVAHTDSSRNIGRSGSKQGANNTSVGPAQHSRQILSSAYTLVGYEVANYELSGEVFSSPVIVGGRLFVGCRDDHVYALDFRFK